MITGLGWTIKNPEFFPMGFLSNFLLLQESILLYLPTLVTLPKPQENKPMFIADTCKSPFNEGVRKLVRTPF
jgi:hypothetical protein